MHTIHIVSDILTVGNLINGSIDDVMNKVAWLFAESLCNFLLEIPSSTRSKNLLFGLVYGRAEWLLQFTD